MTKLRTENGQPVPPTTAEVQEFKDNVPEFEEKNVVSIFKLPTKKEVTKPSDLSYDFSEIMKVNQRNAERLKRERSKANDSTKRIHRIRK